MLGGGDSMFKLLVVGLVHAFGGLQIKDPGGGFVGFMGGYWNTKPA